MDLPYEMVAHIFQYLDAKSLLEVAYVSHFFHAISEEQLKWLKSCFTKPKCQSLLYAAILEKELLNRVIDAKFLYESIEADNIDKIKELLFSNQQTRMFLLCAPYYEATVPTLFPRALTSTRTFYLTETAAKNSTPNATRVKHWLWVNIVVDKTSFEMLYKTQKLQSAQTILSLPVSSKKEQESKINERSPTAQVG